MILYATTRMPRPDHRSLPNPLRHEELPSARSRVQGSHRSPGPLPQRHQRPHLHRPVQAPVRAQNDQYASVTESPGPGPPVAQIGGNLLAQPLFLLDPSTPARPSRVARPRAPSPAEKNSAELHAQPGRRSWAQGRWPMAHAPVTRWTDGDRGPQADAEERITSVHRAIEIREKRRGPLVTPCLDYVALQATSDMNSRRSAGAPGRAPRTWQPINTAGQLVIEVCSAVPGRPHGTGT